MNESQSNRRRPKYLIKHDILMYYYNTYIGLAIIFMILVFLKMAVFPWQACLVLLLVVSARVLYGVFRLAPIIACPYCEAGHRKKKWISNAYYLSMVPLEKEVFECPTCGKEIEVVDEEE